MVEGRHYRGRGGKWKGGGDRGSKAFLGRREKTGRKEKEEWGIKGDNYVKPKKGEKIKDESRESKMRGRRKDVGKGGRRCKGGNGRLEGEEGNGSRNRKEGKGERDKDDNEEEGERGELRRVSKNEGEQRGKKRGNRGG